MEHIYKLWLGLLSSVLLLESCTSSVHNQKNTAQLEKTENSNLKISTSPDLLDDCHISNGATVNIYGSIITSTPNINLSKESSYYNHQAQSQPKLMILDQDHKQSVWYEFEHGDCHPSSKHVAPMDCTFGPDGNMYITDNQYYTHKGSSRLLRIKCKDGKPVYCEVLVDGFNLPNSLAWRGNTLYVTESKLTDTAKDINGQPLFQLSAVYAFELKELNERVIQIQPYENEEEHDNHILSVIRSSGHYGFGVDGISVDSNGNLYTVTFDDDEVYKITLNQKGEMINIYSIKSSPKSNYENMQKNSSLHHTLNSKHKTDLPVFTSTKPVAQEI